MDGGLSVRSSTVRTTGAIGLIGAGSMILGTGINSGLIGGGAANRSGAVAGSGAGIRGAGSTGVAIGSGMTGFILGAGCGHAITSARGVSAGGGLMTTT
jgi:hypothetical protein